MSNLSSSPTQYSSPEYPPLPPELSEMSPRSKNEVIAYSILFIIAATGNLTVFFSVCQKLAKLKWRITVLMLHLSIADLIVTFFLMPLEIFWRISVQWLGGNLLCKGCQFLRAFGLYLSSNILICISLDRFIAILFPLRMVDATKRVKRMIAVAWAAAAISSTPQVVVFSVQHHPDYPNFRQCVSFNFFQNPNYEILYQVFHVSAMYFVPLIVTVFTYSMILWKISSKSGKIKETGIGREPRRVQTRGILFISSGTGKNHFPSSTFLTNPNNIPRKSSESVNLLARAKKRTLRMTFIIVVVFVFCWTPYAVITLWYTFDAETARRLNPSLQSALFAMAVANSCLNPIVYGNYTKVMAGSIFKLRRLFLCLKGKGERVSIEEPPEGGRLSGISTVVGII